MPQRTLCLGLNRQFGRDAQEQILLIRDAGFNEVFFPFGNDLPLRQWAETAKKAGVPVQSVHAPFGGCRALWEEDAAAAEKASDEIAACIRFCAEQEIPIAVSHVYIGFDMPELPKERGLERYHRLIRDAQKYGVTLAFENTEGEEYLAAIFDRFGGEKNVGFCLDTGHEMCYNRSEDLLARYGKYLAATHINDNLGIKDRGGRITWLDDLHLLPFDGIGDWADTARRLARENYRGTLTFELNKQSKPGRHENDIYDAMPIETYLAECYKRACRFEKLARAALETIEN